MWASASAGAARQVGLRRLLNTRGPLNMLICNLGALLPAALFHVGVIRHNGLPGSFPAFILVFFQRIDKTPFVPNSPHVVQIEPRCTDSEVHYLISCAGAITGMTTNVIVIIITGV